MKLPTVNLPEIKIKQAFTAKSLIGLWLAVDTILFTYCPPNISELRDHTTLLFLMIQIAFFIELFGIEKPAVGDFFTRFAEAMFTPDMTDSMRVALIREGSSQFLDIMAGDAMIKSMTSRIKNSEEKVSVDKVKVQKMLEILSDNENVIKKKRLKFRKKK